MNALSLMDGAVLGFIITAVLSLVFAFSRALSGLLAGVCGAISSLMAILAAGAVLTGAAPQAISTFSFMHMTFQLTALSSIWLIALCIPSLFVSVFNIAWHRHAEVRCNGFLLNLLMAAAVLAVTATNFAMLIVMAEIMALCAVFLTGCSQSGKLWFLLGRLGTVLLVVCAWLIWARYGTLNFVDLQPAVSAFPLTPAIWILGLLGFGLLAGIIPLHGWVPQAHANASAPAAALFSAVVLKVGLYGILTLSLLGSQLPLWWGVVVLLLGMLTAFVGGLYALMEHNINRLLAYHALENIGIILLGLGVGLIGCALNDTVLIALGLTGGLYHLINHSLFKTTLFLGAGAVWFRTGYRDIEKLGGMGKRMPAISLAMLVGLMAMAALPPLNGFAGEWLIYQSFFHLSNVPLFIGRFFGPMMAVGLAITGALAVMCMAKVYGVTFLGAPRTAAAEQARSAPVLMNISVIGLALCCVVAGVAAPWLLPLLQQAVPLPLVTAHSTVSQPMMTLLLVACPFLPFLLMMLLKGDRLAARSKGMAWVCGYDHEQSMVITAHGFAMPVKGAFAPVLKLRNWLNPVRLFPGWQSECVAGVFRRLALIELAVLLVVVITRGV